MQEITIGGYTIEELKAIKAKVQPDAVKFVSQQIDAATALVNQLLEAEGDDIERLAKEATDVLESAQLVSGLANVEFSLPYNEEYYSGDGVLTSLLDDAENIGSVYGDDAVGQLFSLLEDMESQSRDWHSSRC
jgi:hypothetical protein